MRKIHFSEIDPVTFGREVAQEIFDAADGDYDRLRVYANDHGAFWDRVWAANGITAPTDEDIESSYYLIWTNEAEIAMRLSLYE